MRKAWLLSLGVHAALVLAFVAGGARMRLDLRTLTPQPDTIEIEIAPPAPAPPAPVQASLPAVASAPPPVQPPVQPPVPALQPALPPVPRRAPARSVTPAAPDATSPPESSAPGAPAAPAAPGALAMRGSVAATGPGERRPSVPGDLSPAHAARLVTPDPGPQPYSPLDLPGPPPEQPDVRDGWMPTGGGTYAVGSPGFTARIARDGQVTIDDKPSFQIAPGLPGIVNETITDPSTGEEESQIMVKMDIAVFDVTDWVMRMAGMDPYASAKLRLLDQTREVRAEMRARARIEDLRDAIALLPRLLQQVWHDPGLSAAERRELLFRIWDECIEIGPGKPAGSDAAGDGDANGQLDELARASRTARATVLGFIRRTLPPGSPDAYTEAEIDALNARRKSAERFVPYP